MKKLKKISSLLCTLILTIGCFSTAAAAEAQNDLQTLSVNDQTDGTLPPQEFTDLEIYAEGENVASLAGAPESMPKTRATWAISDPIFVGNGTLADVYDAYLIPVTSVDMVSFLKLDSTNPNLMVMLYQVKSDGQLIPTNWQLSANAGASFRTVPKGTQFALVIGSISGTERGDYTLMWNASSPAENATSVLSYSDDLTNVLIYYSDGEVLGNGINILTDLQWKESETWYTSLGYSSRNMSMKVNKAKGMYLASFSSSAPYSAPNALLVDVQEGSWSYMNSYYSNDEGDVIHVMDWYDLSGMKTPRTFGEGPYDFSYGPNYIVIDLDTFQVCDFLSPFNYHYTPSGGRTYELTLKAEL